jgi:hypothetical protein
VTKTRLALLSLLALGLTLTFRTPPASSQAEPPACIPSGGIDDTLYRTSCCSGRAVPGSTYCINPLDWYTTWESCSQICA